MAILESMNLDRLLKLKPRKSRKKIGNNTYALVNLPTKTVEIYYHDNLIGRVSRFDNPMNDEAAFTLYITDAGWGTPTTRDRINQFLGDNGVKAVARQEKHVQILNYTPLTAENRKHNLWESVAYGYSVKREALFIGAVNALYGDLRWVNFKINSQ